MVNKQSWAIFWLLFLFCMFDYMDRMVIVSLFPFLKLDMGMTDMNSSKLLKQLGSSLLGV